MCSAFFLKLFFCFCRLGMLLLAAFVGSAHSDAAQLRAISEFTRYCVQIFRLLCFEVLDVISSLVKLSHICK